MANRPPDARRPRFVASGGRLARLLAGVALGATLAEPAAAADHVSVEEFAVGRWKGLASNDESGRFRLCAVAAPPASGIIPMLTLTAARRVHIEFLNYAWRHRAGDEFAALIEIDRRWREKVSVVALGYAHVRIDLGPNEAALDYLRRGRVLTVQGLNGSGPVAFDLTGTAAAIDRLERCVAEHVAADRLGGAGPSSAALARTERAVAPADAQPFAAQVAAYARWLAGAQSILRVLNEIVEHLSMLGEITEEYRRGEMPRVAAEGALRGSMADLRRMHAAASTRVAALPPFRSNVPRLRHYADAAIRHLRALNDQIRPMLRDSEETFEAALRGDEQAYRRGTLKATERKIFLLQSENVNIETHNASVGESSPQHHLNAAMARANDVVIAILRQAVAYQRGEGPDTGYRTLADRSLVDLDNKIVEGERLIRPTLAALLREVGSTPTRRAVIGDVGNSFYASFAVEKKILGVLRILTEAAFDPTARGRTAESAADLHARIDAALSELLDEREALQTKRFARLADLR